nr:protein MEI2-like 4 [Tanacetum cinerariifolium]
MCKRLGNRQFNRIGGSLGRSIKLNDNEMQMVPLPTLIHMLNGVTMA